MDGDDVALVVDNQGLAARSRNLKATSAKMNVGIRGQTAANEREIRSRDVEVDIEGMWTMEVRMCPLSDLKRYWRFSCDIHNAIGTYSHTRTPTVEQAPKEFRVCSDRYVNM